MVAATEVPGEIGKVAHIVPLCAGRDMAIQAGAKVGLVPRELACTSVK